MKRLVGFVGPALPLRDLRLMAPLELLSAVARALRVAADAVKRLPVLDLEPPEYAVPHGLLQETIACQPRAAERS